WSDDRPAWSCSCPCQPFSKSGKGLGFDDERHLWPAFHWLAGECEPVVISGSTLYKLTWKQWTTPSGVSRLRLRASGRRTSVTAISGWPTPLAADARG